MCVLQPAVKINVPAKISHAAHREESVYCLCGDVIKVRVEGGDENLRSWHAVIADHD